MSLNMMCELPFYFGDQCFKKRAPAIKEMIRFHNPDLIGVQEFTNEMIPYLEPLFKTYGIFGRPRSNNDKAKNERNCILYRKDRFELLEGSTFWLSSTPDQTGTSFFTSLFPRIATYGILKDKYDNTTFTFCNTHLDHLLPSVRYKQILVLKEELSIRKKGDFLILSGDFNTSLTSKAMIRLFKDLNPLNLKDTLSKEYTSTIHPKLHGKTFHKGPIDHIFVTNDVIVHSSIAIQSLFMGVYPSDHFPVLSTIEYLKHN